MDETRKQKKMGWERGALNCSNPFEHEIAINDPPIAFDSDMFLLNLCIKDRKISGSDRTCLSNVRIEIQHESVH